MGWGDDGISGGGSSLAQMGAVGGHRARVGNFGRETRAKWLLPAGPVLYSGDAVDKSSKALPSFHLGGAGKAGNNKGDQNKSVRSPKKETTRAMLWRVIGRGGGRRCLG